MPEELREIERDELRRKLENDIREMRLGVIGTIGLFCSVLILIHLLFYFYHHVLDIPGIYSQGLPRAWVWIVAIAISGAVCGYFLVHQDRRNRQRLTDKWDSWHWFDHGVDMFDSEMEFSGEQAESFAKASELDRDDPYARTNLGATLIQNGKLDQAIQVLNEAIKLKPDYHKAYTNMGIALVKKNDPESAARMYRKALELNPRDEAAHLNLGLVLANLGRRREASSHLRAFIQLVPSHPARMEIDKYLRGR